VGAVKVGSENYVRGFPKDLGQELLFYAAAHDHVSLLEALLNIDVSSEVQCGLGFTALCHAAREGRKYSVATLISRWADTTAHCSLEHGSRVCAK
jgi:hypothetical protein